MDVRKAVFPVAGMGTRFLPATKATPKEMLPIVDKPIIQYAMEEAIAAGITEMIFVTSTTKRAIEDHFDSNYELENKLEQAGKQDMLDVVRDIVPKGVSCAYIRQPEARGLGHAVLCAKSLVGNEPFAVILADDMIYGEQEGCLSAMVSEAKKTNSSVVAVEQVPADQVNKYGVIDPVHFEDRLHRMKGIVEKPPVDEAPSDLAVVGRYILSARIFELLEHTQPGSGNEIQLTDAIAQMLVEQNVFAYQFEGVRYDCGSKLGYLQATVEYALRHPELEGRFNEYLKGLTTEL